ncbi:MAG: HAD hydrolase-like protein [Bdellovibrionaceae bacterium]|nr:HAD hydrolase-like protein [Pseudobdellovibrionaceae bacterium]
MTAWRSSTWVDFRPYFTSVYGSEADGTHGDKGELIALVLKQEDKDVNSCVMIGDREHDMIGARKNKMRGIGVSWGYGTTIELMESGAETVLLFPHELTKHLNDPRNRQNRYGLA